MSAPGAELLRLRCRGHAEIRATHDRTLEFAVDTDITGRATCVLGVAATVVGSAPPGVAGPVRITVSAGGHRVTVRALANSAWRPGDSAVVRRSGARLPTTLATGADLTARDLPRDLALALADPEVEVDVVVERDAAGVGRLVRFRAGDPARLAAERAAADAVVAEDDGARALLSGVSRAVDAAEVLRDNGRVLAVSTSEGPHPFAAEVLSWAERPVVEVLGLPPELAVAAVSPRWAPVLVVGAPGRREVVRLAGAHRTSAVVFRAPGAGLARVLDDVVKAVGTRTAAVVGADAGSETAERPVWGPVARVRELVVRGDVLCALDPVADEVVADGPAVSEGLVTALLAQSVSPTTIVKALAGQPGWSRKQAYDLVLRLNRDRG
ncbi:DUF371 domain-containing protein [Actinokineospora sp. PR83]|uniref:DUF371 domain-containing protein n=1 Tax=Actinokineospora sp. PR83 TaxID=2884908 RepID=UPI001F454BE2|nr:DUF371 domain-containing protein [Actinokineospora sp. PR83]MCG8917122.1 DUF371 domain-containing protein [Actinokineospora sp. PR83]